MIKVETFSDSSAFEARLTEIGIGMILSTHVGADKAGFWYAVVYRESKRSA